jgi:hypothetical protein
VRLFFFQGKPPDWQDFVGIITLLIINSTISFIEERTMSETPPPHSWHLICTPLCIGVCTNITSIESVITQDRDVIVL